MLGGIPGPQTVRRITRLNRVEEAKKRKSNFSSLSPQIRQPKTIIDTKSKSLGTLPWLDEAAARKNKYTWQQTLNLSQILDTNLSSRKHGKTLADIDMTRFNQYNVGKKRVRAAGNGGKIQGEAAQPPTQG